MKLNSAWWLLSTLGLGVIVAVNGVACGTDNTGNSGGSGGGEASSSSSSVTSTSTGGPKPKGDWLGLECTKDADCGEPGVVGTCALAEGKDAVFQGGPSNGYCTLKCQTSGDCPGVNICFKPNANATEGRCVLGCELGPELMYLNDPLDGFKCHGREDVACYRVTAGDLCLPTCGNDEACPENRYCNLEAGVCLDKPATPPTGKKLGLACDPMAMTNECANGFCIGSGNGKGFCTGVCPIGGDINYGDCGGIENGLCLYLPVVQGCPAGQSCVGAGDVGFCGGGCKAHDECGAPDLWCRGILMGGPVGYCVGEDPCPNGQADCKSMGTTCTDTTVGKFCIDPKWPLGTLTPAMDGGVPDGGDTDGGASDAGPSDAGPSDAGSPSDAGGADAGDGG